MARGIQNLPGGRSLIIPSLTMPTTTGMTWLLFTPTPMILFLSVHTGYNSALPRVGEEKKKKKTTHGLMDVSLTTIPRRKCRQ